MNVKYKINDQLIEKLISQVNPAEVLSKNGLFSRLKKRIIEKMLEAEIDHELGYKRHSREKKEAPNRRNGNYGKTIIDKSGSEMRIEVTRDGDGEYAPKLVPKGLRRIEGFDDQVISMSEILRRH